MSDPTATPQNATGFNRVMQWFLPALLIGSFLWRVLTPAHDRRAPLRSCKWSLTQH